MLFYSGHGKTKIKKSVAFTVRKNITRTACGYTVINDSIILSKFAIISADEKDEFYEIKGTRKQEVLLVIGDWNAKAGNVKEEV